MVGGNLPFDHFPFLFEFKLNIISNGKALIVMEKIRISSSAIKKH